LKWIVIAGIWTGAMILWASSYLGASDFEGLGVVYPIGLWPIGMVVIVVAALAGWIRRRRRGNPSSAPNPDGSVES
jgi:hypothetical protein